MSSSSMHRRSAIEAGLPARSCLERLGINLPDSEADSHALHLHNFHGLPYGARVEGRRTFDSELFGEAVRECEESCSELERGRHVAARRTIVKKQAAVHVGNGQQRGAPEATQIARAKQQLRLLEVKDIGELYGRTVKERRSGQPLVSFLVKHGLTPHMSFGRRHLYHPDAVAAAHADWQGNLVEEEPVPEVEAPTPSGRGVANYIEDAARTRGLVTGRHIAIRGGITSDDISTVRGFLLRLMKRGLTSQVRVGITDAHLFEAAEADRYMLLSGVQPTGAWPPWIEVTDPLAAPAQITAKSFEREQAEAKATELGLVTSWQIAARFNKWGPSDSGSIDPNFISILRRNDVLPKNTSGRIRLYDPIEVDAIAIKRRITPVLDWPNQP